MMEDIILYTLVIELVTIFFRFGLDMQSTRDTSYVGRFSRGYRIHHGYIGMAMVALVPVGASGAGIETFLALGWGLVLSDLIHHFLVLKYVTGHHEFDIKYPPREEWFLSRVHTFLLADTVLISVPS